MLFSLSLICPFQSTLPMRGGTSFVVVVFELVAISIHPPHAGRDPNMPRCKQTGNISIHPPHAGRDLKHIVSKLDKLNFNPPSPCGEGLFLTSSSFVFVDFNPPSPCGEGQHKFTKYIWKLMHISQNKPLTEEHTAKYSKFSPILWRILQFSFMRTYRGISVCFPFASLNNQHPLRLIGRFRTEMLNFCLIAVSQIVKSQTVLLLIHDPTQLML